MDKLFFKDFGPNVFRGLKLIRALNFDPNTRIGPIRVEIAATSACNYRCWFCASHSYLHPDSIEPLFLSDEIINNLFIDLKKLNVRELLFSGDGEPLLSKAMIKEIKQNGKLFKIEILTNGGNLSVVDEELFRNLTFLTISLNSGNGKSHQITHGYKGESQFPGIVDNIERLLKIPGANKKIKLNYVITADNYEEIDDLIKMAAGWGVLFMARPVKADDQTLRDKKSNQQTLENLDNKVTQYLAGGSLPGRVSLSLQLLKRACQINSLESIDNGHLYPCYMSYIASFIRSNGDVLLCSSGQEKPLGNLNRESFQSIWQKRQSVAPEILATQMNKANQGLFTACRTCVNVQYHSLAFHNIYSKIPLLPGLLENRSIKLNSLDKL